MKNKVLKKILAVLLIIPMIFSLVITSSKTDVSALAPAVFESDPVPVNPNANQTCKNFYQYLCNVGKSNQVITGATSAKIIGIDTEKATAEADYHQMIKDMFGVTPMIISTHDKYYKSYNETHIDTFSQRYEEGAIPMFPVTPETKMVEDGIRNLDATNPDRDMTVYNDYIAILDKVANFCLDLEEAGVEVYFIRLFLEHNNSSWSGFYGASDEGYQSFKNVWKQTIDYLVKRGVTGALFVYSPAGMFVESSEKQYPGEEYVDVNGPTVYSNKADGEIFVERCATDYTWMREINRPFAMTELGARNVMSYHGMYPIGDYKETLDSILYAFPETAMVVLWSNDSLSIQSPGDSNTVGNYNGDMFIYHPNVIVAEEAVDYRSDKVIESNKLATFYKDVELKEKLTSLTAGKYSANDLKSLGISISDIKALDVLTGYAIAIYETNDCTGDAQVYFGKSIDIGNDIKNGKSISIFKLDNLSLEKDIWADNESQMVYRVNDGVTEGFITESYKEDSSMEITIDLGAEYTLGQICIDHAGFYENHTYNLRDFAIYTSLDNKSYEMQYKMVGNTAPQTNVYFDATKARFVCLKITKANSSKSEFEKSRVSLAEISVFGAKGLTLVEKPIADNMSNSSNILTNPNGDKEINLSGQISDGYAESDNVIESVDNNTNKEQTDNEQGIIPPIVIPEFYNYVWLIICGGILLLASLVWVVIIIYNKRRIALNK